MSLHVATLLALPGLVALVYWPGLGGPFIFDDFPALVGNQRVHLTSLAWGELWKAATSFDPGGTGRQLAMASFAINHALGGLDPWGWKLGGLVVHLANAVLVYVLCLRLLALVGVQQYLHLSAAALALAWAVHPLQVSAVLYVVQRMETLCLTFTLLALLAYLRGRRLQIAGDHGWPWLAACAPLLLLALGAKESALLLPLFTLALELTVLAFGGATQVQQRFWRWAYALGCMVGVAIFVTVVVPHYAAPNAYFTRDFDIVQRLLSQLRILPMYLGQILLPIPARMPFYYDDFEASTSLLHPWTTLAGGLLLGGLLLLAAYWRKRAPLAALGVLWFFAGHAMTSNVVPLELVFEHRNYFALLGVLLVLAEGIRRIPVRDSPAIKVAGTVAVVLALGFLGAIRSATWGDRLLLAVEHVNMNPDSPRALQDLGIVYYEMSGGSMDSPFFSLAMQIFEREAALPRSGVLPDQTLVLLRAKYELPGAEPAWDRLVAKLRDRPLSPESLIAFHGLIEQRYKGVQLDDRRLTEAVRVLMGRAVLTPHKYAQFGDYLLRYAGEPELAANAFANAVLISLDQGDEAYARQVVKVLAEEGRLEHVTFVLEKAREAGFVLPNDLPEFLCAKNSAC
ncbi:hypothetical protein EIM48_01805 [Pseudoxanthomonas sp. SGNA-20]|uniref:hypothetical protein n=1 Tax=Pseudoxanthomonas sp. SGNA-20 TaxID=2493088 RepID=UPI000F633DEB|nr:hypothetical protein [Pseudoxanthomonas sp. SGNA-20]RRN58795.1 hypothetical protein EIM48_01805 [Pseudoxanthomonas sp. SGNA-20]